MWLFSLFMMVYFSLMAGIFFLFDRGIIQYFYEIKNSDFVYVMKFVTRLGEPTLYLAAAALVYLIYRKQNRAYVQKARFLIGSIVLSGIVVNLLKGIIGRYRPVEWIKSEHYGFDNFSFLEYTANSFPSGHATTAFAVGISLMLLFPKYRYVLLMMTGIVALSRVVLYQHYMTDVMAGALVGGVSAYILYQKMVLDTIIFKTKGSGKIGSVKTV